MLQELSVEQWAVLLAVVVWAVRVAVLLGKILQTLETIRETLADLGGRLTRVERRQDDHERRLVVLETRNEIKGQRSEHQDRQ